MSLIADINLMKKPANGEKFCKEAQRNSCKKRREHEQRKKSVLGKWHHGSLRAEVSQQGGPGSVRFRYGSGVERFERFRFSVPAVPLQERFFCVSVQFNRKGRCRFRFRFLENGSGGSGSAFGFGKNGSDGSGSRFRFGS